MNSLELRRAMLPVAALTSSVAGAAQVQEATPVQPDKGTTIDDIVVTAQRRSQVLLGAPLAISALNTETLTNEGNTNSANLAAIPAPQVLGPCGNTQLSLISKSDGLIIRIAREE